jgi:prephenate dehydrogenase
VRAAGVEAPIASVVALLGVGYMGGSLALALRAAGATNEIVGYDPGPEAGRDAVARGIVDRMADSPAEAVKGAGLVILAAPVRSLHPLAQAIAKAVAPSAVVIDLGSVKAPLVDVLATGVLAQRFVGCHPLAGTEVTGVAAADARLYAGKPCFVCPAVVTDPSAVLIARQVWERIGSSVIELPAEAHDDFMAAASHLPHVAAFALALGLEPDADMLIERIPPTCPPTSLRDSSRVAASNPAVWRDILLENRRQLLPRVRQMEASLAAFRRAIENDDSEGLFDLLSRGQKTRRRIVG